MRDPTATTTIVRRAAPPPSARLAVRENTPRTMPSPCTAGKLEFDYSVLRKGVGRMVAVVMEPGVKNPRSWAGVVGAKLGTKLYVDLAADEAEGAFAAGVRHLTKEIQDRADGSFGRGLGRSGSSLHPQPASLHPQPAAVPDGALAPCDPELVSRGRGKG